MDLAELSSISLQEEVADFSDPQMLLCMAAGPASPVVVSSQLAVLHWAELAEVSLAFLSREVLLETVS